MELDPRTPSSEFDEYEKDTQNLLGHERTTKKHKQQQKRNWAFLAVNVFILLLNVGLLLMISTPRSNTATEETPVIPRLPHQGTFIRGKVQILEFTKHEF